MSELEQDLSAQLLRALTAPGVPSELRGEEAAADAFRKAMPSARPRRHGQLRLASGVGVTALTSGLVLSATVVTAAAYTAALPHEAQRAVHHLFHRLGVPVPAEHRSDLSVGRGSPRPHRPAEARTGTSRPPHDPSAGPEPAGRHVAGTVTLRLDRQIVTVGQSVQVEVDAEQAGHRRLTGTVQVEERTPGSAAWNVVLRARLDARGRVSVIIRRVDQALELRALLAPPAGAPVTSPTLRVGARPVLLLTRGGGSRLAVQAGPGQRSRVVILQERIAGTWKDVQQTTLDGKGDASFVVPAKPEARVYRALLHRSPLFDTTASTAVTVT